MGPGGDKSSAQAKLDSARREQQIVALALRGIPFHEIGRQLGIGRISAFKAFRNALRRNTDRDIQTHHRIELADLDMEQANVWRAMDANRDNWQVQLAGTAQLRGIHIRRAHLLGLDAPAKFDVRTAYGLGGNEASEAARATELAWLAMPPEERARIYDSFHEARKRLNAPIETTATVTIGPDNRNDDGGESSDDE